MSTKKLVTDSQGLAIARQGRDMKVGRDEWQNAPWGEILRGVRDGLPITVGSPIVAPPVKDNSFTRRLFTGDPLGPTGTRTRTIAKATDVFTGYIDLDFTNLGLDLPSRMTDLHKVDTDEMVRDGTFRDIFEGYNTDLNRLCLTQAQIIRFCVDFRHRLRTGGYGTFFLFKKEENEADEFFVASVGFCGSGQLGVDVRRLDFDRVWGAEGRRRVVVPQLVA